MAIPTRVREALAASCGGRVTLTAHEFEGCVSIYPETEWQCALKKLNALPNTNRKVQALLRRVIGHAVELEMDANGRVLVPPTLREFAGFEKKLMLVGMGNKFELWSEEAWSAKMNEAVEDDDIFADLSL